MRLIPQATVLLRRPTNQQHRVLRMTMASATTQPHTTSSSAASVARVLGGDVGACTQCVMRLTGTPAPPLKRPHSPDVADEDIERTVIDNGACPCCFGALQLGIDTLAQRCVTEFRTRYGSLLASSGSKEKRTVSFTISLLLPTQIALRQAAFKTYTKMELGYNLDRATEINNNENDTDVVATVEKATIDKAENENGVIENVEMKKSRVPEYDTRIVEVKEVLRGLLGRTIEQQCKDEEFSLKQELNGKVWFVITMDHRETQSEFMFMNDIPRLKFSARVVRRKGRPVTTIGASWSKVSNVASHLTKDELVTTGLYPPKPPTNPIFISSVECRTEPTFIAGRYLKLQRHISNSPWTVNGQRMTERSVEELIGNTLDAALQVESHKFYSSGREDSDVLMLGSGRPFYFEMIDPKMLFIDEDECKVLEDEVNKNAHGMVAVRNLCVASREQVTKLKEGASTKEKSYCTKVRLSKPIPLTLIKQLDNMVDIKLAQRNPTRVPRRADLIREKYVLSLKLVPMDVDENSTLNEFSVELRTSAGTYVKEFVHGDGGRTVPCIPDLLRKHAENMDESTIELVSDLTAECTSLDVLDVHLDWP